MKKILTLLLIMIMLMETAGCAAFRKKFVRKRKDEGKPKPVLQLDDEQYKDLYDPTYLYGENFLFWQSSESELINLLNTGSSHGGIHSHKREIRTAQMAFLYLENMQEQLTEDNKAQLEDPIKELSDIVGVLQKKTKSSGKISRITRQLERHFRRIRNEFHPHNMEGLIKEK